jgi:serine/threonine protein phosphatase 1
MFVYSDITPVSGPRLDAFQFPTDVALLVVGDIHGQMEGMRGILEGLGYMDTPGKRRHLVFNGDFIDRGPDSISCLDFALSGEAALLANADDVTFLPGNHELMLVDAIEDSVNGKKDVHFPDNTFRWLMNGGCEMVLEAYSMADSSVPEAYVTAITNMSNDLACCGWNAYASLRRWPKDLDLVTAVRHMNTTLMTHGMDLSKIIRKWPSHLRIGDALCVHAGINPKYPLEYTFSIPAEDHCNMENDTHAHHWAWIRKEFLETQSGFTEEGDRFADEDAHGLLVFHGHTPAPKAALHRLSDDSRVAEVFSNMNTNARVCVDGGAARNCGVAGAILTDAGLVNCFHPT